VSHVWPCAHAPHWTPLAPHSVDDSLPTVTHVPLLQHPLHEVEPEHVQAPAEHVEPELQLSHVAPPVPQAEALWVTNGMQLPVVPPLQQPFGQVVGLQAVGASTPVSCAAPVSWPASVDVTPLSW
jgi:hypothetical protein